MTPSALMRYLVGMLGKPAMLADRLPWWLPVGPDGAIDPTNSNFYQQATIWTTRTGGFLRVVRADLPDTIAASPEDITAYHDHLLRILNRYGDGWRIMFDMIRMPTPSYLPACDFQNEMARLIDEERRGQFSGSDTFDNATFITIRLLPDDREQLMRWMRTNERIDLSSQVDWFDRNSRSFIDDLATQIPGVEILSGDELATYLAFTASYREIAVKMPSSGTLCANLPAADWYNNSKHDSKVWIGDQAMATVEVRDFGEANPDMLEGIYSAPFPLRCVAVYDGMSPDTRAKYLKGIEKAHNLKKLTPKGWMTAVITRSTQGAETNPESERGISMVRRFKGDPSGHPICRGWVTVTTWGSSRAEADARAAEIEQTFNAAGIVAAQATLNDYHALMANIPGLDGKDDTVCKYGMLIPALTRLAPVTGVDIGPAEDKWAGGPALAVGRTPRGMPYRFALTRPGSDLAHIVGFGQSGSGKSTLAGLFSSHMLKYPNSRVLICDTEMSALVNCWVHGGDWTDLGGSGVGVQPLRHVDEAEQFSWAYSWLIEALREEGVTIENTPTLSDALTDGMKHIAAIRDPNERTLTRLQAYCSMDMRIARAIGHYCKGQGPYGEQYDGVVSSYGASRFVCIEIFKITRQQRSHLMISALFQALYRDILNGKQPTLWVADELAPLLRHPVWGPRLENAGLTMRKHWCALMLLTQDIRHFDTPAGKALLAQMATRLFFPNRGITQPQNAEPYLQLGFQPHMLELVANGRPKSDVVIQTEKDMQMVSFALGPIGRRTIGAGTAADKARAFDIREHGIEPGEPFRHEWFRETTAQWIARTGWGERRDAA